MKMSSAHARLAHLHRHLVYERVAANAAGDKVAVVTGVGPATGASIARRFSAGGYKVAMIARNKERLADLERELGPDAVAFPCNLSKPEEIDAMMDAVEERMGTPSVLVYNAARGAVRRLRSSSSPQPMSFVWHPSA